MRPRDTVLLTPRLRLEPLGPRHSDELWRAAEASLEDLRPWLMWAVHQDGAGMAAFAERAVGLWERGSDYVFALVSRRSPVGVVGLHGIDSLVGTAELGYWISSRVACRGLITEAGA